MALYLSQFFQLRTQIKKKKKHSRSLHTNPRIAQLHKMQTASHLLQNEALHSKYHKHLKSKH